MDAKLFNGTTKYQKFLMSPKITYLDYIKLHGVPGNPSGTIAGSFASRPKIDTCMLHLFSWIFSLFHLFKKNKLSVTGETKSSLNNKAKLARTIYPPFPHNVQIHNVIQKKVGVPSK